MFNSILVKVFIWITILGALLFFFVIREVQSVEQKQLNYRKERLALDRAKIDFEGQGADVKSILEYLEEYKEIDSDKKKRVEAALPRYFNEVDTYRLLRVLASESGLRDITPTISSSGGQGNDLQTIEFQVAGHGTYDALYVLLKQLEYSLRIFHITDITLARQGVSSEGGVASSDLIINVSGKTYYYPEAQEPESS